MVATEHRPPFLHSLGPLGPFPRVPLTDALERRWLHYAFLSRDGKTGMVANAAWLGPPADGGADDVRTTAILLLYLHDSGWTASQFNASSSNQLWSAFRHPHGLAEPRPLHLRSVAGHPGVDLMLHRTSRPCTSQCAPFAGDHHLRWQSEPGVRVYGSMDFDGSRGMAVDAVGYHERVRGRWGWPELDEWVFGFANDLSGGDAGVPPEYAGVFTFIKPRQPNDATTASFMLWHKGVVRRHFPRRRVSFAVRGELNRDAVQQVPALAGLLGVRPMAPVPKRLVIAARMGNDWATLEFEAEAAARIVIPSETSLAPFSVHEVIGPCLLEGELDGVRFAIETRGIVEFAGGAGGD